MMRDRTVILIALIVITVLVVISFMLGYRQAGKDMNADVTVDTIHKVDTFFVLRPQDTVTNVELVPYKVHDTAIITHHDTTYVMLPYEHHCLSVPDTLYLWFSGVGARVDSLRFLLRTTVLEVPAVSDDAVVKDGWLSCYGGVGMDYMDGMPSYKMFLEAEALMFKRMVLSASAGAAVRDKATTPYIGITMKYKIN